MHPTNPSVTRGFTALDRTLPDVIDEFLIARRDAVAALLYGLARGDCPEELVSQGVSQPVDPLEALEMRDHADLVMSVATGRL